MTEIILNKFFIPHSGAGVTVDVGDHRAGVLWDDFKAHLCPEVKNFFLSQDNLDVDIFPGGLKAVVHPIDKVINKLFNDCFL